MIRLFCIAVGWLFWMGLLSASDIIYIANKGAVEEKCNMTASFCVLDSDQQTLRFYQAKESKREQSVVIYSNRTGKLQGFIPFSEDNYHYLEWMNQNQVSIHKTCFDVLPELIDTSAMLDPDHLTMLALQRSSSARNAIDQITTLAEVYGYTGDGVSFVLSDNHETWLLQMVGKGAEDKGVVWVALRYPPNTIAAVGEGSFVEQIVFDNPSFLHSSDVVSFAREKGWYEGTNSDFNFYKTYVKEDPKELHRTQKRIWEYYKSFDFSRVDSFDPNNDSLHQKMPLYITPSKMLDRSSFRSYLRRSAGWGSLELTPSVLQRLVVTEMRDRLSSSMAGLVWITPGSADVSPLVPLYMGITELPYLLLPSVCVEKEVPSLLTVCRQAQRLKEKYKEKVEKEMEQTLEQFDLASLEASLLKEKEWGGMVFSDSEPIEKALTAYCTGFAEEILYKWLLKVSFWEHHLNEDPFLLPEQNIEHSQEIIPQSY